MKNLILGSLLLFSMSAGATELVKVVDLEDGRSILASKEKGLSLYTFDRDDDSVSNCSGGCLKVWPPMLVNENIEVCEPFGVMKRPNGDFQLMVDDKPLYFFIGDEESGDIRGDQIQGVWHIVLAKTIN